MATTVAGVVVGALGVASFTVLTRPPTPIALTVDSFSRVVLEKEREDLAFRDVEATEAVKRLDAQFQDQLAGHRFAYGGDGATLSYGGALTLTIVDTTGWDIPKTVSLRSSDTSCVSEQPVFPDEDETDPDHDLTEYDLELAWTDCVFFDEQRNLPLRLSGHGTREDILGTASQFRDELHLIHADLIA